MQSAGQMLFLLRCLDFSSITGAAGITITGSAGIAMYPDDTRDAKELVEISFKRMFAARDSGGNRVSGGDQIV